MPARPKFLSTMCIESDVYIRIPHIRVLEFMRIFDDARVMMPQILKLEYFWIYVEMTEASFL